MAKKKQTEEVVENKLQSALDKLNKSYGSGSVLTLNSKSNTTYDIISTGSIGFDHITLGVGGFVKGRLYELMGWEGTGKSTICGHVVAECQKAGGKVLYIDGEHAVDKIYFEALGVNTDDMLIAQPGCGEEGFQIAMELINTGEIDLVIIDSDSSLIPKKVLDGDVGDSSIGYKARLNSNAYPKLKTALSANNVCVIVISQYREKIGVMFGCLHGETLINFTDGRSIPIRKVVKEQIEGNVYAIDEFGKINERKILDWHVNGLVYSKEDFIHIESTGLDGQNRIGVTVTPNHKVLTSDGWKEAREIKFSDKLVSRYRSVINGSVKDFFYGIYVGDSTVSRRAKVTANLRFQDKSNPDYLKWKIQKLSKAFNFKEEKGVYQSEYCSELHLIQSMYPKRNPMAFFDNYSDLGLALWFMDDAHLDTRQKRTRYTLSVKRVKDQQLMNQIKDQFKLKVGVECTVHKDGSIQFTNSESLIIASKICKYVPESMQYKLPDQFKNKYEDFELEHEVVSIPANVDIKSIRFASDKQFRYRQKFDITVEKDECYMAGGVLNGILVHNSPTTTQGGHALKFYSDCRIEVSRSLAKEGDVTYGNITKEKKKKNKMSPPYKMASFEIVYGKGIDKFLELLELGYDYNILYKRGDVITYKEVKYKFSEFQKLLEDNPDMEDTIKADIIAAIKNETVDIVENDGL